MENLEKRDSSRPFRSAPASVPRITPVFPLLVLETMREHDRPVEVLEAEDLTLSMPRRFGLSEVVRVQIQRFQDAVRQRRLQLGSEVEDLVRLVVRRADAEEIFRDAGKRIARHDWTQRAGSLRKIMRFTPGPIGRITAQRADPSGRACAFYGGAFGELLQHYTRREYRVLHPECAARGGAICRWTVEVVT
jgi:hypothetical protein